MFPLHFHYEDVSRQDPLLKPNHANVMEVPGSCEIRVVAKAPYNFIIKNGKLAMEIPRGQKFIQTQRGSTGKSFRSNPFLGSNKDKGYVSDLARQSTLRGHGISNFSVRISTIVLLLLPFLSVCYVGLFFLGLDDHILFLKIKGMLLTKSIKFLISRLGFSGSFLLAAIFFLLEEEVGGTESGKTMMVSSGSSGSEPSVTKNNSNVANAGPSGTPSSSFEEDSFDLRVLEESSYGTGTSGEGMPVNQRGAIPPANPLEAQPQASQPAQAPPHQQEGEALRNAIHALVFAQVRDEAERRSGYLSRILQSKEWIDLYSDTARHLMVTLEISEETDTSSLQEWADRIRNDQNLLKPLIKDYLSKKGG